MEAATLSASVATSSTAVSTCRAFSSQTNADVKSVRGCAVGGRGSGIALLALRESRERGSGSGRKGARRAVVAAVLGEGEPEAGGQKKKKGIKRDEEPEQYWQTQAEREGKNPMQTLLPYLAILGILTPFIILGLAFAAGYIKTPNY